MALAQQWPDIEYRAFSGNSDNVFWDMIHALENKEIDGVVDDEPAFGGVVENSSLKISFTIETKNMWGVALAPDNYKLKKRIDESLTKIQKNGKLKEIWKDFFSFQYPDDLRLQIEFISHV
jgi:ABC-type amino acid transport substrate-binding protein